MSFNPEVGRWFARHAPERAARAGGHRGRKEAGGASSERHFALWRARPDFLAYDIRDLPSALRRRAAGQGHAGADLDLRSLADRARAAEHANQIIYEAPPR